MGTFTNTFSRGLTQQGSLLNQNVAPSDIVLSATSIVENSAVNTVIGTLSTTDPNGANTFTYTLVSGMGSTDNASFNISGASLRNTDVFDYETKNSYSIRIRTTDQGGLYFEKQFTITITNVEDWLPYSNVLVLGNSIVKHELTSYWWGKWGMAASIEANDFIHKLQSSLQAVNPTCIVNGENIAAWEAAHTTYDKSNFDSYFTSNPDLVIIRLTENISNGTGLSTSVQSLIDYVWSKVPNAKIILTGGFMINTYDSVMSTAAATNGLTYTELYSLFITANKISLGDIVYDADGNPHTVISPVPGHPNDAGMLAIANKIFDAIYLSTQYPIPVVSSALIANATPTKVELTFNVNLNNTSIPMTTDFVLAGKTISSVGIVNNVVTLTVSSPYIIGDIVTVNYTKPVSNKLKSLLGAIDVDSFTGQSVTNNISSYDADASALFSRMTAAGETPTSERKAIINTVFVDLKANGLYTKADSFGFLAAHAPLSALMWWNINKTMTATVPASFVTDQGYVGSSASDYIPTGFSPATNGVQYTRNNASVYVYSRTASQNTRSTLAVLAGGNVKLYTRMVSPNADNFGADMNSSDGNTITIPNADGRGFYGMDRFSSTQFTMIKNKTRYTLSKNSGALTTELYIDSQNVQVSFWWFGASLSQAEAEKLYDIVVDGYLNSVGAKV